tara:strand:- start:1087 stop:1272 length:186 start_codon:yes stop_codon:yes gene_type:complete
MSIFNKQQLRQKILHKASVIRPFNKFSQVSMSEMEPKCEAAVDNFLKAYLHSLPSVGKTIK